MILEFFGLPGCGKTTVSHLLADDLRKKGYRVAEPSYFMLQECAKKKRIVLKLFYLFLFLFDKDFLLLCNIIKKYNKKEFFLHLNNLAYKFYYVKKYKKYDYLIFDEGLFQGSVSMLINSEYNCINEIISQFNKNNVFPIYLKTSIDNALNHLKTKRKNISRVEKINNNEEKIKFMKKVQFLCENIDISNGLLYKIDNENPKEIENNIINNI